MWRTHDPSLEKTVRVYTEAATPVHKQPVAVLVSAAQGAPLSLEWTLTRQPEVRVVVHSEEPLGQARERGVDEAYLRDQLGRLGNTPYVLNEISLQMSGRPFVPSSLLNQLRRQAVEQLQALQGECAGIALADDPQATLAEALDRASGSFVDGRTAREFDGHSMSRSGTTVCNLHLLVRTPEQLEAALALRPVSITLDYLDLYGLRPAVEAVQVAGIQARVASPRVLKPNEQRIVNFLLRLGCSILVRSAGLLEALMSAEHPILVGDFSLNAANVLTAHTFLSLGLERLTPTHDLNAVQVAELAQKIGPERLEVIAYQHLPVFHTEHCVFCRFLSTGTSYKDCGHPCEQHKVALRDVGGREHPVMADVGCRNTVFGAEAQNASLHLELWQSAGIREYRLEFVHETAEQVMRVVEAFRSALDGQLPMQALTRRLQQVAPQGVTEGSLFVPEDYLEIPLIV